jgi:SPP1 gp7 family putative phage head morphogenesis protein
VPNRKDSAAQRRSWQRAQRAELQFARALRKVAARCGALTRGSFDPNRPMGSSAKVRRELENYGQTLQKWAKATAERMVQDVSRRDEKFWYDQSKLVGKLLKEEIKSAPTGIAARQRTMEAAALITSLPLEAAQRIEQYAVEYMTRGIRASELAKRVMATGEVTKSRANLIARTETSRTAGLLQEVRAKSVGSTGYIWRTSMDIDVRDRHRKLEGKFFTWDKPPIAGENGERAHPGGIYNCRCYAEVILPGEKIPKRHYAGRNSRAGKFRAEEVREAA